MNVETAQYDNGESVVIQTQNVQDNTEFVSPRPLKRFRKVNDKPNDNTALLASAVNILQNTAGKLNSTVENPEVKSFCSFLATKMMGYSTITRQRIQHAMYTLLVQADSGVFETPPHIYEPTISSLPSIYRPTTSTIPLPTIPYSQNFTPSAPQTQISNHQTSPTETFSHISSPAGSYSSQYSDDLNEYT